MIHHRCHAGIYIFFFILLTRENFRSSLYVNKATSWLHNDREHMLCGKKERKKMWPFVHSLKNILISHSFRADHQSTWWPSTHCRGCRESQKQEDRCLTLDGTRTKASLHSGRLHAGVRVLQGWEDAHEWVRHRYKYWGEVGIYSARKETGCTVRMALGTALATVGLLLLLGRGPFADAGENFKWS